MRLLISVKLTKSLFISKLFGLLFSRTFKRFSTDDKRLFTSVKSTTPELGLTDKLFNLDSIFAIYLKT